MLVVIILGLIVPVADLAVLAAPGPRPQVIHPVSRTIEPKLVYRVAPHFPGKAARAGVTEGTVFVQAVIHSDGHTSDLKVIQSDPVGLGFEKAALRAVAKWQYEPLVSNGEVKTVLYIVKVDFRRDGSEA